jgi:hypothetical protein
MGVRDRATGRDPPVQVRPGVRDGARGPDRHMSVKPGGQRQCQWAFPRHATCRGDQRQPRPRGFRSVGLPRGWQTGRHPAGGWRGRFLCCREDHKRMKSGRWESVGTVGKRGQAQASASVARGHVGDGVRSMAIEDCIEDRLLAPRIAWPVSPDTQISSRCSTPSLETFAFVISSTWFIQISSGLSASHSFMSTSGGDSFQAQPS